MHIAILTFDGFNELDSLIAFGILNRVKKPDWRVSIASPTRQVTSMNGLVLQAQVTLANAARADAVLIGSGSKTREVVATTSLMEQLTMDPQRQLLAAQCSGTLVQEAGVEVLNQPFFAKGNIATSGGCLGSQYLAGWLIARLEGMDVACDAMHYVAPVGEKEQYVDRMVRNIAPYLSATASLPTAAAT
jgi:transcriptional regulator GlxA family with amidase domain